jgi:IS30 family transposase
MTKKQHYMTWEERCQLEALLGEKVPVAKIAKRLGFCRQTIYDEIKRRTYIHTCAYWDEERYSAEKGQQIHNRNQTAKGKPLKIGNDRKFADFLEKKMLGVQEDGTVDKRKRCSPAAALALAKREEFHTTVCVSTLYSYIEKRVFLHLTNKDLWEKGKKKKRGYKPVQRVAHPKLPSISTRPEEINQREEKGHWEIDLVVGKDGSRPVLLTMVERSTKKPLLSKLPDGGRAGQR